MLSQAEIDALLNGSSSSETESAASDESLSSEEIDALGELGNISMGTSATTLFTLLGQKVSITTPRVTVSTWDKIAEQYASPYVNVKVEYTNGLVGTNILILKEDDVKVITDLMMGGAGNISVAGELTELHLSAISEAMNQMIGSCATSMSTMFSKKIDISPPKAYMMHSSYDEPYKDFDGSEQVVKIAFRMEIGSLIDSEIMQVVPISFAKTMVGNLMKMNEPEKSTAAPQPKSAPQYDPPQQVYTQQAQSQPQYETGYGQRPQYEMDYIQHNDVQRNRPPVNVQPAQFQSFDDSRMYAEKKNISLIMDVPLQVTVELGRTQKLIKEVLEFVAGSVIELDKLAGEPVDILVNGKAIAKGEVVVIDESFGVRVTDIIHPSKRL